MPERRVQANGLSFHVLDEGEGEPVVLLHGFPDTHTMWRHQVPALRDAGYRVIAPDLRGRGATDRPLTVQEYFIPQLIGDVREILAAMDVPRARFVGHDWGAPVAWMLASFEPDLVERLVAISVGHPACFAWPSQEQRERSWYMLFFQFEGIAEAGLMNQDWRLFREWTRHHPETDSWIESLSQPGALTAALNWYRANVPAASWFAQEAPYPGIAAPTLGIIGSDDPFLTEEQMRSSGDRVEGPWRSELIQGGGHWLPLDHPSEINALLLDFLG